MQYAGTAKLGSTQIKHKNHIWAILVCKEEGLIYRRQGKGRRVGLGDRILAALAVSPRSF